MEHAVALCDGPQIEASQLPRPLSLQPEPSGVHALSASEVTEGEDFESLMVVENRHIRRVLDAVGGNKTRAAKILGIDRKTLLARLQRR